MHTHLCPICPDDALKVRDWLVNPPGRSYVSYIKKSGPPWNPIPSALIVNHLNCERESLRDISSPLAMGNGTAPAVWDCNMKKERTAAAARKE